VHSGHVDGEPRRVGERGHLDLCLGAVGEGAQHLRIHVLAHRLVGDVIRGVGRAHRVVLPLAGRDHLETEIIGELDEFEAFHGFVTAAHRVDGVAGARERREQLADRHVGFDRHECDIAPLEQTGERHLRGHVRHAGDLDNDVQRQVRQLEAIGQHDRSAMFDGIDRLPDVDSHEHVVSACRLQCSDGPVRRDIGDRRDLHPPGPGDLGDQPAAHLAGTDDAHQDRPAEILLTRGEPRRIPHRDHSFY
jgi:hypothetical protein